MTNPFEPPAAEVADPASAPMPSSVRVACTLVLLSLAIGICTLMPGVRPPGPDEAELPFGFTLAVVAVFGGITVWLVQMVRRGRNWGRWVLLGYLALGWWLMLDQLTEDFTLSPLLGFLDIASILIEIVAAVLLFIGASARWFR